MSFVVVTVAVVVVVVAVVVFVIAAAVVVVDVCKNRKLDPALFGRVRSLRDYEMAFFITTPFSQSFFPHMISALARFFPARDWDEHCEH